MLITLKDEKLVERLGTRSHRVALRMRHRLHGQDMASPVPNGLFATIILLVRIFELGSSLTNRAAGVNRWLPVKLGFEAMRLQHRHRI